MREFLLGLVFFLMFVVVFLVGIQIGEHKGFASGYLMCQINQEEEMLQAVTTKIAYCESRNKHEGVWGKAGEYGIAQFKPRTFKWMAKLAGHPEYSIKNRENQLALLEWAIQHGYGNHWNTCYKRAIVAYTDNNLSSSLLFTAPTHAVRVNTRF